MSDNIAKPSWASTETVKTIALFAAMFAGTFGANTQTVGTLTQEIGSLKVEVIGLGADIEELRTDLSRTESAIDLLRAGTVNATNISRIVAITDAIAHLDPDNTEQWTADGRPRISALEAHLKSSGRQDYKITAIERDHACAMSQCKR